MHSDHSAIFQRLFPDMEQAVVQSAIQGIGVICLHNGMFHLVWWDGDIKQSRVLMWEQCRACSQVYDIILDSCPDCIQQEEKVA